MSEAYAFDVFLSHSSKDNAIVRELANRLRADGLRVWFDEWMLNPGESISSKIAEGLERSRVLVFCMSAQAFGPDWSKLESDTFRFRDPLNKDRQFLPLRLDDSPIKDSLAQFPFINWLPAVREKEYAKVLEACRSSAKPTTAEAEAAGEHIAGTTIRLDYKGGRIQDYAFSADGKFAISGASDNTVRLWDLTTGNCLRVLVGHRSEVRCVAWSTDQRRALSGSIDRTVRLWDVETGNCLRVLEGHTHNVMCIAWSTDERRALTGSSDDTVRLWDVMTGSCLLELAGHADPVYSVAWSSDELFAITGSVDKTVRIWDLVAARCVSTLRGHTHRVSSVAWSMDQRRAISGSHDKTVRLWDIDTGRCQRIMEGHRASVGRVRFSADQSWALSSSYDKTVRLWDTETGRCVSVLGGFTGKIHGLEWGADPLQAFAGDEHRHVHRWNLTNAILAARDLATAKPSLLPGSDQVEYSNAKVLVVGDTNSGKSSLTHRLATAQWKPSEGSTVGAWCTQWQLKDASAAPDVDREIWLWDFGGQADQRLIHQLYLDRSALILLVFNADQEDVLPGLRDWQTALRRSLKEKVPLLLVAGRIDAGIKASRGRLQAFAMEQGLAYYETSAKSGEGCDELRVAMIAGIPWDQMEKRTSPRIFKLIKDEILKLREEGEVLHTFKELRELLWRKLPDEPRFTDDTLQTVIGLLAGPGAVKELEYGTYILLAPEWINAYAQAVIRTLRSVENNLGVLPLRSIAEGKLIFQSVGRDGTAVEMRRLPPGEERVVLGEMEWQLEQRGLCLRQGSKLVFPSHCGRDRPAVVEHPSIFVSYAVKGFLDDIYATLVVKLADSESFKLTDLWRDAADFVTLMGDHHMGLKLTRENGSEGYINVYFGKGVTEQEQVIFANYIHAHLEITCEQAVRLRHYVCPTCHTPKGNPEVLMKKLLAKKQSADTECDGCGERFPLWDALEKKFASDAVRRQVEELQADDLAKLTTRRKGKLLVLDVGARITSANQKWFEVPGDEDDGIDIQVEFTDDAGNGVGKGLCLQLKAGNSFLKKRKSDGAEIFVIRKQRWVRTWINQPYPVMLVIGTFSEDDEGTVGIEKMEFAEVRWMEITSVLRALSANGTKPVKQIEFKGERLDLSSVREWREKLLASNSM